MLAFFSNAAQAAAPTYQAQGAASSGTGALTPVWPAHQTDDIALLIVETANQAVTLSSNAAGFVEVASSPQGTGTAAAATATRLTVFWTRATSNGMANPTVADSGDHQTAQIVTFRGVYGTGNPWDVTVGDVLATASNSFSIPGATTTVTNSLVVAIIAAGIDSSTANQRSGWTNASLTGLTERVDSNTSSGNGGGFGAATGVKTTAGTYNGTTGALAATSVQGRISIALKPKTTTLGDGTNPANATLAPSAAITDLDAFTLQTSNGTDSLTALTVTLTGTNSFQALSEVRITSSDGATTYFSAVTNPASNTISFSGGTPLPVTSSATTFKVRITPKTHANMPVPPGLSYSVGGTVTAFTNTNEQLGSDGASAAVTVDNLSPASATTTSGSAGIAKNTLNWTSSAATDFNTTSGSIVYRWAAASAGSEVPAEGSTPTLGSTNGTATVACAVSSAASTALARIDGTGGSTDCTTTALTNGQAYTYKVFQKDSNGNYDVGVTVGTFTPSSITLADGTNPSNVTLAPSATITDLDAFTLQTSNGTDSVTALTVTLTGINSFQVLSEVRITSSDGATTYFSAVTNPTSNTISFSGGTPLPATSAATTFKVRITPKTHANMPVPPGLSYSVGGTITAFTSTKVQAGSDGASATLTVDNLSPASATAASGSSDNTKVALNWTTSVATDFNTTSGSVVYRWAAASAGSEVPVEGSTPTLGSANGTATVACVVSSAASTALVRTDGTGGSTDCTTTALTNGQAYTYKVFQKDSNGNYDVGAVIGTVTPAIVNCISQATGNWSATSTWTQCRSGIPLVGDTATIANGHNVTLNVNTPTLITLTINSGGTLTNIGSNTITLSGALSNAGTYSGGSGAVTVVGNFTNTGSYSAGSATTTLSGNFSNSGTFTAGTGTLVFSGSSAQSITGGTSFNILTLNNTNGLSLNSNVSVTTKLNLTSGILNTGAYKLTILANCPGSVTSTAIAGSGASTDKFVYGNLQLTFPSGTTTCTFNIGTGSAYAPIDITLTTTLAGGGTLTGTTYGSEHPQLVFSGIEPTKDANRYWSLGTATAPADTISVSSYSPTFHFTAGDLDVSSTATNFSVGKYAASTWTLPSPVTANAYSTVLSTITASLGASAATDFMVGESTPLCTVPSYSPPGTTCQCDFFSRVNLNPSTIFGGNWNLSSTGATAYTPQINSSAGHMQLTPNSTFVSTSATLPGTFPAAGNMISVEFKHYAYGGTVSGGAYGADGIALTLSDSNITPVAGAFGGSLGYAQKCQNGVSGCLSDCSTVGGCPGFAGGWIGVGIDEFGNFSYNGEGRSGGSAPGPRADSVAARGSGSGQAGYPYLGGTATLTPAIGDDTTLSPSYGHSYRLIVDARNYTPSNKTATVTLDRDTTGTGNSYTNLINLPNIYTTNPSQADVPTNWVFSYTGSTGGSKNIHEIASLKVCGQSFIPPSGYRILVDNLKPTTCTATGSPTVTVSAMDTNGNVITGYDKTVTLAATLSGGGASHASLSSQVTNHGTWVSGTNSYTFVAADNGVAKFTLTDTTQEDVYITVSEFGSTLNSTTLSPVQYRSGVATYTLANIDNLAADTGGGVVAGRPHRFRVTRNLVNCGGIDTTYNGRKYLDGWYTPASGDHPNGAGQPQVCTTNAGGTCLPAPGSTCQTMSIAEPALDPNSNNMPMDFTAGISDFCLVTNDVGKYSVYLRDDLHVNDIPSVAAAIGTSSTLTARPFTIVVSDIFQGSTPNPASSNPAVSGPFVAGSNFSATVGGYLWNNSSDTTSTSGLPGSVNKTTMISSGLAPHYADTVTLAPDATLTANFVPNGSGTVQGSVTSGAITVTNGSSTASTLKYSEVGSFTLKATPSNSYLNSGVDLANRVSIFADNVNLSRWVGRFRPDYFELSGKAITNRSDINAGAGCAPSSAFTYMGEPMKASFTLTAKNALGATTQNYIGDYVKFSTSPAWASYNVSDSVGLWAVAENYSYGGNTCKVIFDGLTPSLNSLASCSPATPALAIGRTTGPRVTMAAPTISAWAIGAAAFTTDVTLERGDTQDGPYTTLKIGISPQDSDGVQLQAAALNLDSDNNAINERALLGTTQALFGRLNLQNAYGSELLNLPMSLTAEEWNGVGWVTNAADSCTALAAPAGGGLTLNLTNSGTTVATLSNPLVSGDAGLSLSAPGANRTGFVDVIVISPNWLDFNWKGAGVTDPTGRATFGIYKGNSRFIYIRELY